MKKNYISEYLSDEDLNKIAKAIGEIEKQTSGELRVSIKKQRGIFQKKLTTREIALNEFFKQNMHKTKDKTGVLFLIIFDEHKFEIIADEGINAKISLEKWNEFSDKLKNFFSQSKYLEGILHGLNGIGNILIKEFPIQPGDKDELSNEVIVEP